MITGPTSLTWNSNYRKDQEPDTHNGALSPNLHDQQEVSMYQRVLLGMDRLHNKFPLQASQNTQQPPPQPNRLQPVDSTVKDFAEYGKTKPETEYLKPESFGLSNKDYRHKNVIDSNH